MYTQFTKHRNDNSISVHLCTDGVIIEFRLEFGIK